MLKTAVFFAHWRPFLFLYCHVYVSCIDNNCVTINCRPCLSWPPVLSSGLQLSQQVHRNIPSALKYATKCVSGYMLYMLYMSMLALQHTQLRHFRPWPFEYHAVDQDTTPPADVHAFCELLTLSGCHEYRQKLQPEAICVCVARYNQQLCHESLQVSCR